MTRFVVISVLLAAAIACAIVVGARSGWYPVPSMYKEVVFFLFLSTTGLFTWISRWLKRKPEDFVKIYLGATVLRILFFGAFIFAVIMLDSSGAYGNVAVFLVSYFLFTALEVAALFSKINARK